MGLGISDPKAENEHYHSMAEELKSVSVTTRFGVDPDVLRLGLVSFLTDVSSEMIFSVFAIFFTTIAGASSALLGLVEGFADFSASSLDYVAGWWSDKTGRRKAFAVVGKAFIADVEPERRATAIGVYNFVTGVIYLPASLIAGALWAVHPSIVFIVAAFLSLAAIAAFVWLRPAGNST